MLDDETITQQLTLLATHRRTLAALLQQQALLGGMAYASPGVLNSIEEARAEIQRIKVALRGDGVSVENQLNDETSPRTQPPAISPNDIPDMRPRFKRNENVFTDIRSAASHLFEWKTIHSSAQNLMMSLLLFEDHLRIMDKEMTEKVMGQIEYLWYIHCDARFRKALKSVEELQVIRNQSIDDLYAILTEENNIRKCLLNLKISDFGSLKNLRRSCYMLNDALKENLILADLYITQIAEELKRKSMGDE